METKILKHNKNLLLNREEYTISILSESNPSFIEVSKHLGKHEELTVVKGVKGNFGRKEFCAEVFVYGSKEAKDSSERMNRKARKKLAEETKKAEEAKKASEGAK